MAGLNTTGLAGGFAQGMQLVQSYQDQQAQRQQRQQQNDWQERQMQLAEQRFAEQQRQYDDTQQREDDQLALKSAYAKFAAGMPISEQERAVFQRRPWADPGFIADPKTREAIDQGKRVMASDDPTDVNDPVSLEALNHLMGPQIQRGGGGRKRITGVYPGQQPGTFAFELDVEDSEGNHYNAPMTRHRGTAADGDDEVLQVPAVAIANQLAAYDQQNRELTQRQQQGGGLNISDEQRGQALAYGRALGLVPEGQDQWETVQGPGGSLLQRNTRSGEMKSLIGRAPQSGGSGGYSPTSAMRESQWLVQQGIAPDMASGYDMATRSARDGDYSRARDELEYYNRQIEEINKQIEASRGEFGFDEPSPELVRQRAQLTEQRNQIAGSIWGGQRGGAAASQSQDRAAARQPARDGTGQGRAREPQSGGFDADAFLNDVLGG